jgi:hypothetical protein
MRAASLDGLRSALTDDKVVVTEAFGQLTSKLLERKMQILRENGNVPMTAQAQFENDCRMAGQAEEQRRRQLETYRRQYLVWADKERQKIIDHNAQVE